jgi:hypothetical protein
MAQNPGVTPPVVETLPSVEGGVSAIASAHAPFLYFESAPAYAHLNGIIRVTLTASRDIPILGAPKPGNDQVIVAHLRMNIPAAQALRAVLDSALQMAALTAAPPAGTAN